MSFVNPLNKTKEEYAQTIDKIKAGGAVGIDAQYTHAIVIEYLKQISTRLENLEQRLQNLESNK